MIERYSLPRMKQVWEAENKFKKWLEIEVLACEAWAEVGVIPREAARKIRERSRFQVDRRFVRRVEEIEAEVRHDVIAFTTALAEKMGEEARYIHYGLTSYDVVDTALSVLMVEAADILREDLERLLEVLARKAVQYRDTAMVGRTHGVHAEPITFGLKVALWWAETRRNLERLQRAREAVRVGKLSGAVGTYAHLDPRVEEYVCNRLGLEPAPVSSQILQRDRHAEYLTTLAIIASSLDKFAVEIRGLQRTEIREVEEPFRAGQKGSSAMPHKRNPVTCEQISGLARVVRGNALAALENIPLWHERDISNSSVERIIIPDSTILVDYLLHRFAEIMDNLRVYPDRMLANLELTGGLIFSQRVLLALVDKGMRREDAYALVQGRAMQAWEGGGDFRRLMEADDKVRKLLTPKELAACFDYRPYLERVDEIFRRLGLQG